MYHRLSPIGELCKKESVGMFTYLIRDSGKPVNK